MMNVMFIESDPVKLSNCRRSLSHMRRKWNMSFFDCPESAIVSFDKQPADVVVCSADLQTVRGAEILRAISKRNERVVRILLADPDRVRSVASSSSYAHRTLAKPCDPGQLDHAVSQVRDLQERINHPDVLALVTGLEALPVPSRIVRELNDVIAQDEATIAQVAEVVSSDMNMSARLLQLVNSAYFSIGRSILDIKEAISFLGLSAVRDLCVAVELMETLQDVPTIVSSLVDEMYEQSLNVAHIARTLVSNPSDAPKAYVGGLLRDCGLFAIARAHPQTLLDMRVQVMRSSLPLTEVEMEHIGVRHSDVGAALLELWGLPYDIIECVALHHDDPSSSVDKVDVSTAIYIAGLITSQTSNGIEAGWDSAQSYDPAYFDKLGLSDQLLESLSHS